MLDLKVIETNNGGDLVLNGNDLSVIYNTDNMIYLALFGGNVEQSTKPNEVLSQSFDFWGNTLFLNDNPSAQFNSETERVINTVALTSNGRVKIENAIKEDLSFFKNFGAIVIVSVQIIRVDFLRVEIRVEFENQSEKTIIINFRKQSDGDFFLPDFNDDFNV